MVSANFLFGLSLLLLKTYALNISQDPRVQVALTTQYPVSGVSTTPDGRIFVLYTFVDGSYGPQLVEWHNSSNSTPYPDAEWTSYAPGKDRSTHFLRIESQRIGPDGQLWVVDTGSPNFLEPVILPEGPKLVRIDLTTNNVSRIYHLGNVTLVNSVIDDIRFNPSSSLAYLTDAGAPGIIIVDLSSGEATRVLQGDPTTKGFMPVSGEGQLFQNPFGGFIRIYADQHEVSPDGKYYYYQPSSGGMSRIETQYLNEALYNSSLAGLLTQYPEPFALTPSTGGTAIDRDGNIYNSDLDRKAIIKIAPNGTWTTLVQDPRLIWVDAMWIDASGKLWMPANQFSRGSLFHNGTSYIEKPLRVYTMDIGIGPSPIDHA